MHIKFRIFNEHAHLDSVLGQVESQKCGVLFVKFEFRLYVRKLFSPFGYILGSSRYLILQRLPAC